MNTQRILINVTRTGQQATAVLPIPYPNELMKLKPFEDYYPEVIIHDITGDRYGVPQLVEYTNSNTTLLAEYIHTFISGDQVTGTRIRVSINTTTGSVTATVRSE